MVKGKRLHRRAGLYTALMLLGLTLWPALAAACPPVLQSVTVAGNHPTSTWTLPATSVTSQFVQTSRSSEVNEDGYFTTLVNFNPLAPSQTTLTDNFNFEPGTYYLHVAGNDKRCRGGVCAPIEFSDVMSFDVAAAPAPAAAAASVTPRTAGTAALNCGPATGGGLTPLPPTTGGPGPDKVKPFQTLSFAPIQDVDKLFVRARMSEVGKLRARATVSVAGASKVYKFKTVTRSVTANKLVKLRLKLVKKRLKAVKRALRRGKKLKAKVTVTATDKAGNNRAQKATIRLKP
jgi:hypothetical protein